MDTGTQRLLGEKDGAIGWMIFNHPERRNALSIDMWQAIPTVLGAFEADPEVRVIVFKGAGDKAFISGADISQFGEQRASAEANLAYSAHIAEATRAMTAAFQTVHRHGRRFLHRRRPGGGPDLRPAHLLRRQPLWHPRRQAWPRLRLRRPQGPRRPRRTFLRQGDPVHGPPLRRRRGAADRPCQQGGEPRRSRADGARLRRHDRSERAL